jgi:hypothetical protein
VLQHRGVDLHAADQVGVAGRPVPDVLDPQHGAALVGGDGLWQPLVPRCDARMRIVQPDREVQPSRLAARAGGGMVGCFRVGSVWVVLTAHRFVVFAEIGLLARSV